MGDQIPKNTYNEKMVEEGASSRTPITAASGSHPVTVIKKKQAVFTKRLADALSHHKKRPAAVQTKNNMGDINRREKNNTYLKSMNIETPVTELGSPFVLTKSLCGDQANKDILNLMDDKNMVKESAGRD